MLSNVRYDADRAAALYPWLVGSAAALTTLAAFRFLLLRPQLSGEETIEIDDESSSRDSG